MPRKPTPKKRAFLDEEDDDFDMSLDSYESPKPGVPRDEGDPLWTIYGVNPGLPFRVKVEQLIIMWDLGVEEIASALGEEIDRVQSEVTKLNADFMALGDSLDPEQRRLARGKMIKELLKYKAELEQLGPTQDSKIINMKINIADKIAKLRGLESEKKEITDEPSSTNPIDEAMAKMTPEQRRSLLTKLSG